MLRTQWQGALHPRLGADHLPAMSDLATIHTASAPAQPQSEQKPVKKRRIPRRIAEVVQLITTGQCVTVKDAAERAGMHPNYVYTAFKKPEIIAYIEQQTRVTLARLQAPAAAKLGTLLASAASEHVQKDVAIHLLSIAGHKPASNAQVSVSIDIKAGYVIDLSGDDRKPMIDVSRAVLTDTGTGSE